VTTLSSSAKRGCETFAALILRSGRRPRLEGWQQARACEQPSFETRRKRCGAPQDESLHFFTRTKSGRSSNPPRCDREGPAPLAGSWPGLSRPPRLFLLGAKIFEVTGQSPAATQAGDSTRSE